jgi:hypothetical protein
MAVAAIGVLAHPARAEDAAGAHLEQRACEVVDDLGCLRFRLGK